jgi:hypothetical protein
VIAYSGIKFFYSHTTPRDWPTLQRLRVRKGAQAQNVSSGLGLKLFILVYLRRRRLHLDARL